MYEMYADDIFRYVYSRTQDKDLSEDLLSETFSKALMKLDDFDFKQPRAWLYTIARNLLNDHWRKKPTLELDGTRELADDADLLEESFDKDSEAKRLKDAIGRLPAQQQEIVELRFFRNLGAKQVADTLGLSHENVRVIQYRALKALRKELS